jgi:hypothetical protein
MNYLVGIYKAYGLTDQQWNTILIKLRDVDLVKKCGDKFMINPYIYVPAIATPSDIRYMKARYDVFPHTATDIYLEIVDPYSSEPYYWSIWEDKYLPIEMSVLDN